MKRYILIALLVITNLFLFSKLDLVPSNLPDGIVPQQIVQELKDNGRLTPHSDEWEENEFYVKLFTVYGFGTSAAGISSCTGNVVYRNEKETAILTAGHCVSPNFIFSPINILVERYDGKLFSTTEYHIHKNYYSDPAFASDVAIIIVKDDIEVEPVAVKISELPETGDITYLGGFGASLDSPNAHFTSGEVITIGTTETHVNIRYTGRKNDHYACFGSSGGGLVGETLAFDRTSKTKGIIGIASTISSRRCHAPGNNAHFVRLDKHLDFLLKHIPELKIN
jgi:hypothetical protein